VLKPRDIVLLGVIFCGSARVGRTIVRLNNQFFCMRSSSLWEYFSSSRARIFVVKYSLFILVPVGSLSNTWNSSGFHNREHEFCRLNIVLWFCDDPTSGKRYYSARRSGQKES
jgi:hypothetical protein